MEKVFYNQDVWWESGLYVNDEASENKMEY